MRLVIQLTALTVVCGLSGGAFAQDAAKGETVFKKCAICHKVGEGAQNQIGPHLNGVVGRKAAGLEGFAYSPAMKEAGEKGIVWNDENISKYMENPREFIPKNKMAFVGLKNETERADVIAYLKTFPAK